MNTNVEKRPMTRRPRTRWLALGVAGIVAALAAGCGAKSPPAGGANTDKAKEARKQAEAIALLSVKTAADAQAEAVPGAAHKSFLEKMGLASTPAPSPQRPKTPPAPPAPAPPAAPASSGGLTSPGSPGSPAAPTITTKVDPKPAARPSSPPVIKERVSSDIPCATEAEAEEKALEQAQRKVTEALARLDPPVRFEPSLAVVKNEFVRKDSRTVRRLTPPEQEEWKKHGYSPDRMFVEYDVEVSADQVREFRSQDRVAYAIRILAGLTAVALVGFLFLRIDERTKGYLTSWLAVTAFALAGGVAAALVFV